MMQKCPYKGLGHDLSSKLKKYVLHFECLEWLAWVCLMLCKNL